MNGSGWVLFQTIHPQVTQLLREYCHKWPSNRLIVVGDDEVLLWRRDPGVNGGVRRGNQVSDFYRLVANAVIKFPISTVYESRRWDWSYRDAVRGLVHILDSGWEAVAEQVDEVIKDKVLHLEIYIDQATGTVTGAVR